MSGRTCLGVIGHGGHKISYTVLLSGHQFTIVTKCYKFCMGDMLNAFEIIFELSPKLIDGADNRLGSGQQGVVGFVLFVADVLVLRKVLGMLVVLYCIGCIMVMVGSRIIPCRLIRTIMIMVCQCVICELVPELSDGTNNRL